MKFHNGGFRRSTGRYVLLFMVLNVLAAYPAIDAQIVRKSAGPLAALNADPGSITGFGTLDRDLAISSETATAEIPDAPGEGSAAEPTVPMARGGLGPMLADVTRAHSTAVPLVAPLYDKYIRPDETAQALSAGNKFVFGFRQELTFYFPITIAAAAGYEQALNGSPNYGTNFRAYGQRVGAAAARNASQTIFTDSIMAPLLHEDPRYYVLGSGHNPFARAAYAVTRVLVTRTDSGRATPNLSLFAGYAGAAGLTNAYYPPDNQGFSETAKSFGGSLGGAAISNVIREFLPGLLRSAGLERTP